LQEEKTMLHRLASIALLALTVVGLLAGAAFVVRAQDSTPPADIEANKALVLRYQNEVWDQGTTDVVFEVLAPDFTWRFGATEIFLVGPDAVKAHADNLHANIEGMAVSVDIVVAEGEWVAIRWTLTETPQVEEGTPQAQPHLLCTGNDIYRVADGLLAEVWQETVTCL
jgi:hypothetical protein